MSILQWTRTNYFTYFTDGGSGNTHRTTKQVWTFQYPGDGLTYNIWVSGPNPQPGQQGRHNAFAKKHLLTWHGGKAQKDGDDLAGKLGRLHEKRRVENFDEYVAHRKEVHSQLKEQDKYPIDALGGQSMNGMKITDESTLSVVICDWISPEKLKYSFAKAIGAQNPVTNTTYQHVVVTFGDNNCVLRHNFKTNQTEKVNQITITFYCETRYHSEIKAHVVHCEA